MMQTYTTVKIEGYGYSYYFRSTASEEQIREVMEELKERPNGYSDDDIVPALIEKGFESEKLTYGRPNVVIDSDW